MERPRNKLWPRIAGNFTVPTLLVSKWPGGQQLTCPWSRLCLTFSASQISNKCHETCETGEMPEEPSHCSPNRWREDVVRGQKWGERHRKPSWCHFCPRTGCRKERGQSKGKSRIIVQTVIRTDWMLIVSFFRACAEWSLSQGFSVVLNFLKIVLNLILNEKLSNKGRIGVNLRSSS